MGICLTIVVYWWDLYVDSNQEKVFLLFLELKIYKWIVGPNNKEVN